MILSSNTLHLNINHDDSYYYMLLAWAFSYLDIFLLSF